MGIYGRARQATDDNNKMRMRNACWITKATDTHSEYVIVLAFLRQQWLANAPECYIILILTVWFETGFDIY
jgi:hypothetical protein